MLSATLKRALGILCIVVGLVALVLPIVPGALLLFVGMELLGLSFLLPRPVRSRWENFKMHAIDRWNRFRSKRKGFWRRSWML